MLHKAVRDDKAVQLYMRFTHDRLLAMTAGVGAVIQPPSVTLVVVGGQLQLTVVTADAHQAGAACTPPASCAALRSAESSCSGG